MITTNLNIVHNLLWLKEKYILQKNKVPFNLLGVHSDYSSSLRIFDSQANNHIRLQLLCNLLGNEGDIARLWVQILF